MTTRAFLFLYSFEYFVLSFHIHASSLLKYLDDAVEFNKLEKIAFNCLLRLICIITCKVWTVPLDWIVFSLFKQSLILPLRAVRRFRASSISFERVKNIMSDEDEPDVEAPELVRATELLFWVYDEAAKLLHNLLKLTSLESISFSNCRACFRKAKQKFSGN